LVQGITGKEGQFHARACIEYGTQVVAGVTPGKGGQTMDAVPVFNTVADAVKIAGANASMIFVPPPFAADAIMEAADAGVPLIVCITEGIPVMDMMRVKNYLKDKPVRLIGPNCPGVITPGECKIGIMPGVIHKPGRIGAVSRSGTLTYEAVHALTRPVWARPPASASAATRSTGPISSTAWRLSRPMTPPKGIVMIGEIGGDAEEKAAEYIKANVTKPVVGFIAGLTAPPGRRMGHAGAIISGSSGTGQSKVAAMKANGINVCENLAYLGDVCAETFKMLKTGRFSG
jgi:succinyl-CoA synthetase alpha subunit